MLHLTLLVSSALKRKRIALPLIILIPGLVLSTLTPLSDGAGTAHDFYSQSVTSQIDASSGLQRAIFMTPLGSKLSINLPQDLTPGETHSGTIIAESSGRTDAESAARDDEIRNYVIEINNQSFPVTAERFELRLPDSFPLNAVEIILRDKDGKEVAKAKLSVASQAAPPTTDFKLPTSGQAGDLIEIDCPCDGVMADSDYVKVGGEDILVLAESPRKRVALNTSHVQGSTEIEINERGQLAKGEISVLRDAREPVAVEQVETTPEMGGQCANGNVESGNFTNWTGYTGSFSTADNVLTPGLVPNRQTIMSGTANDLYGGFPVVNEGNHSIKIGNTSVGAQADMISYTFLVTPANVDFQFKYAIVLQNPLDHPAAAQPDFIYYMKTDSTPGQPTSPASNVQLYSTTLTRIVADQSNPFFSVSSVNSSVVYKRWVCVRYNLTPWLGQTVTIFFKVRDCAYGAHWGYAYIDNLCSMNTPLPQFTLPTSFCGNNVTYADGSASVNEDFYIWNIHKSDATGGPGDPATYAQETYYGEVGQINIQDWYRQHGKQFECNQYYLVTLTVVSQCGTANHTSRLIRYNCPKVNAGADKVLCCRQGTSTTIGLPGSSRNTYSWTSSPAGFTSNLAQPTVSPTQSTTYTLTVTDSKGCIGTDTVNVVVLQPFNLTINKACLKNFTPAPRNCSSNTSQTRPLPCDSTLSAAVTYTDCFENNPRAWDRIKNSYLTYQWSTGETTPEITARPGITSYTVTVSNGCFTRTATINNVIPGGYFSQGIPTIGAPNAIAPNSSNPANRVMTIFEYGANAPSLGSGPAYHAYRYRLRLFDRWGNLFYCKEDYNACGFVNGEILWNGRNSSGNLVQNDVYVAQLALWNCQTSTFGNGNFPIYRGSRYECTGYRWKFFPLPHKECIGYVLVDKFESAGAFHVTVVR
jgi:hypothetical protein